MNRIAVRSMLSKVGTFLAAVAAMVLAAVLVLAGLEWTLRPLTIQSVHASMEDSELVLRVYGRKHSTRCSGVWDLWLFEANNGRRVALYRNGTTGEIPQGGLSGYAIHIEMDKPLQPGRYNGALSARYDCGIWSPEVRQNFDMKVKAPALEGRERSHTHE